MKDTKELALSLEPRLFINSSQYLIQLQVQNVSDDQYYAVQFDLNIVHLLGLGDTLSPSQFFVCLYDRQYWVGIIMELSNENLDVKVKFMHPKRPTPSWKWLSRDDLFWLSNVYVYHVVSAPKLTSQTARMYCFNTSEY